MNLNHARPLLLAACIAALCPLAADAMPAWWTERNVIVTGPGTTSNDFALANQGQVKHFAEMAAEEMNEALADCGGAGPTINGMVSSFANTNNFAVVNAGQLKAAAAPFWDRLAQEGLADGYPWGGAPFTNDFVIVNLGQLKTVFNFDVGFCQPELRFVANCYGSCGPGIHAVNIGETNRVTLVSEIPFQADDTPFLLLVDGRPIKVVEAGSGDLMGLTNEFVAGDLPLTFELSGFTPSFADAADAFLTATATVGDVEFFDRLLVTVLETNEVDLVAPVDDFVVCRNAEYTAKAHLSPTGHMATWTWNDGTTNVVVDDPNHVREGSRLGIRHKA